MQFRKISLDADTIKAVRLPEISFSPPRDNVLQLLTKGSVGRGWGMARMSHKARDIWVLGLLSYNGDTVEVFHLDEGFAGEVSWEN